MFGFLLTVLFMFGLILFFGGLSILLVFYPRSIALVLCYLMKNGHGGLGSPIVRFFSFSM